MICVMNEQLLEPYQIRHKDILKSEKAGPVRSVIRIFQRLEPSRIEPSLSIYRYMRILDSAVEEEPYTRPVRELLAEEQKALLGLRKPTIFQNEYITKPLSELFGERTPVVRYHLNQIIDGMIIDLNIRHTQKPLTEDQLKKRNFLVTYPSIAIFSFGKFGINPTPTSAVRDTIHDLATYDNTSDIFEDLPTGLILLSQEDLLKHGLAFRNGEPLPVDKLMDYNRDKRKEVRIRLRYSSATVFHLGLPVWFSILLYTYLYTRSLKLFIPLPKRHGLVYRTPLDAIS